MTKLVLYRVSGSLLEAGPVPIDGLLPSPQPAYEAVDLPLWRMLERSGCFQGKVERIFTSSSWRDVWRFRSLGLKEAPSGRQPLSIGLRAPLRRRLWRLYQRGATKEEGVDFLPFPWSGAEPPAGRLLLLSETKGVFREAGWLGGEKRPEEEREAYSDEALLKILQLGYWQGLFDWWPAVVPGRGGWQCIRCGGGKLIQVRCATCGQENCAYCPRCLTLGRVKACQPLQRWRARSVSTEARVLCRWEGELSPGQEQAAKALRQFVEQEKEDEFLVWAVCGAGKTEMLFDMLTAVLSAGAQVLIASPRQDVILELAPRLREAYPTVPTALLYGGSPERFKPAQLYLATTHQTLRFVEAFDLIIVDEEDAFPFHADPMLLFGVERAVKPWGKRVYLTATPRPEMEQRLRQGKLPYVLIPRRFHGHPLPVPKLRRVGRWRQKLARGELLTPLIDFLLHLLNNGRYGYLFLPRVSDVEPVARYVKEELLPFIHKAWPHFLPDPAAFTIAGVHAQHPQRQELVRRFRQHQIRLLLTTTILERGVTIPYSDVAVLGSDDPVFDTAALIQIAGRVGRKAEDPDGEVWFLPEVRTRAQTRAIRQIISWNKVALSPLAHGFGYAGDRPGYGAADQKAD